MAEQPSKLAQAVDLTTRFATSGFGLLAAYFGALAAAFSAYRALEPLFVDSEWWVHPTIAASPLLVVFFFHTLPALRDRHLRLRMSEVSGELQPGYFRLTARTDTADVERVDKKHEEVSRWLAEPPAPLLYLTGPSGSGKTSIVGWAAQMLAPEQLIIELRGFQDPVSRLEEKLRTPGYIWLHPPAAVNELHKLLKLASKKVRPKRLLVVFDQFEEFFVLHGTERREKLQALLALLAQEPIDGLTVLLIFPTDYIGLVETLSLPILVSTENWKEIPPFTEAAARQFLLSSGLRIRDDMLRDVLHEAAEVEQTQGLIRPITLNLCGLVLSRFATGIPRGLRPRGLIRGFLREAVNGRGIRELTPKLIPRLISDHVTKRPRNLSDLADETGIDEAEIRGCLRILGQSERCIVRPLDPEQRTWEISHDFLVPLLDSIFTRWSASFLRTMRPWVPWGVTVATVLIMFGFTTIREVQSHDPIRTLIDLNWLASANPGVSRRSI